MTPVRRAFRECRMQFPDTVSHCVFILLELQRLRTLLKVHPIELHAKLLQAHASCLRSSPRTWIRWHARQRRPGAYLGVEVRVAGLTRIVSGSCASDTPGGAVASTTQTTLPTTPHCRRLLPRWSATWAPRCPEARPHRQQTVGIALHEDPCATCQPMTSPPNGGNCATRGPVRDLPAGDVAIKRGELHH